MFYGPKDFRTWIVNAADVAMDLRRRYDAQGKWHMPHDAAASEWLSYFERIERFASWRWPTNVTIDDVHADVGLLHEKTYRSIDNDASNPLYRIWRDAVAVAKGGKPHDWDRLSREAAQ